MPGYQISKRAKADLLEIARYTERTWSETQAKEYVSFLEGGCAMLAEMPQLGRGFDLEKQDVLRLERGSHVIFYRTTRSGVSILRFLHKSMMAGLHLL